MARDVSVDLNAVVNSKNKTRETSDLLMQNQLFMRNKIDPMLAEWKDDHVLQYLQISQEISQCITTIFQNLEKIDDFCAKEINWIQRYNSI